MHYTIKPYGVPSARQPARVRATSAPQAEKAFVLEAVNDTAVRRAIRERYARLGRVVRCINHVDASDPSKLIVHVETR